MKIEIRLRIEGGDGAPCDEEILALDKPHDQLEMIGLSLAEARELLASRPGARGRRPGCGVRRWTTGTATRAPGVFGARAEPRCSSVRRSVACP